MVRAALRWEIAHGQAREGMETVRPARRSGLDRERAPGTRAGARL